jgi:hypothetical protein
MFELTGMWSSEIVDRIEFLPIPCTVVLRSITWNRWEFVFDRFSNGELRRIGMWGRGKLENVSSTVLFASQNRSI